MSVSETPWKTEDFWTALGNWEPDVRAQIPLPPKITIHDVTLRDGEGTPGVLFSKEEKIAIAKKLDELGVDRIEAGEMGVSPQDLEAITEIAHMGLRATVAAWSGFARNRLEDALSTGAARIVLGIGSGYPTRTAVGMTEQDVIRSSVDAVQYLKDKGRQVTYFPTDTTRAELPFLRDLIGTVAENARPDSVAIVDTRGVALPQTIAYLVKLYKSVCDLPVEVHCHNDFGFGVTSALAALHAGAEIVQVCVSGLGERCGNTALEPFAMALRVLYGKELHLKTELLAETANLVLGYANLAVGFNQPVVGDFAFMRVTGSWIHTLKKSPTTLFPYRPELAGRHWEVRLGKVSSVMAIAHTLDRMELEADSSKHEEILGLVKQKAIAKKGLLTDDEFRAIVKQIVG